MYNKHLNGFVLVADCGSFSQAAEKAYISSNALIQQINLLEDHLGVTLFVRTNHGVKLTAAGASIYQDAKRIMRLSAQAIQKAQHIEQAEARSIRIGTSLLRPCKTIVALWSNVSPDHPGIQLEIVPFDDTYQVWLNLLDNLGKDIDIVAGIYPSTIGQRRCQVLKLTEIPLCCAVSRKNPLATQQRLSLTDLYGETLLMVERGDTSFVDALRDEIELNHPQIHIQDVPSYDTKVFNQCDSSRCAMITIETWAELHPSLVTIPCEWDYTVPYGIIYAEHPSEQVAQFIAALKETGQVRPQS